MPDELTQEQIYAKYTFTEKEMIEISKQMGQASLLKKTKEDEQKSVSKSMKAEIAVQDAVINSCAEKIRSGYEMRKYTCSRKYDFENKIVHYIEVTTGHEVDSRPMSENEQLKLRPEIQEAQKKKEEQQEKAEKTKKKEK